MFNDTINLSRASQIDCPSMMNLQWDRKCTFSGTSHFMYIKYSMEIFEKEKSKINGETCERMYVKVSTHFQDK